MKASGVSLVDANVWLALAVDAHFHHTTAKAWFEEQSDESCAFCRITQMALLRHLTNAKITGTANVLSQQQAWQAFEKLTADVRVVYLDEPPALTPVFQSLTQSPFPLHKQWTDAYLAAFSRCLHSEIVTFDTDFRSFPELSVQVLMKSEEPES